MKIVVIAHNIRSTHNVGSILRTGDGFGIARLVCTGYTPFPKVPADTRLPHEAAKLTAQIHKTALGAEATVPTIHSAQLEPVMTKLKNDGYRLVALEQSPRATLLPNYTPPQQKIALLLGEEVHGIPAELLAQCDDIIEIPMHGKKESFNVSVATGIALYGLSTAARRVVEQKG